MKINGTHARTLTRAFTLIELMVVIAIIGILTAIIMANFLTAESKARDAKRISDLAQIQLAITGFFERCGYYPAPAGGEGLTTTLGGPTCPPGVTLGTFISTLPTPPNGSPSSYEYDWGWAYNDTSHNSIDYVLGTTLENSTSNPGTITVFPTSGTTPGSVVYVDVSSVQHFTTCDGTIHYCIGPR